METCLAVSLDCKNKLEDVTFVKYGVKESYLIIHCYEGKHFYSWTSIPELARIVCKFIDSVTTLGFCYLAIVNLRLPYTGESKSGGRGEWRHATFIPGTFHWEPTEAIQLPEQSAWNLETIKFFTISLKYRNHQVLHHLSRHWLL